MDNFYEEVYQYLIDEGIEEEEATEVVNHLYEANVQEYGLLTENRGKAFMNMLRTVGMMSGILKNPAAKQAVKATTKKITSGTARQGKLLTTKGTAQNFTKGRTPFTGTDPVPAASSALPTPKVAPPTSPGQMQIPGTSARAQELRNVTRNPNTGLSGGGNTGLTMSGGKASQRSMPTLKSQPERVAPSLPQPPVSPTVSKLDKVIGAVKKSALPVGVAGATGLALSGSQGSKKTEVRMPASQTPSTSRPESPPQFQGTGERSAQANAEKQEKAKKEAQVKRSSSQLTSAAKNFDAAFTAARKAGKSEFSWRGKKYNTKYKGE